MPIAKPSPLQAAQADYLEALDREMRELARRIENYHEGRKRGLKPSLAARRVGDCATRVIGLTAAFEALCDVKED